MRHGPSKRKALHPAMTGKRISISLVVSIVAVVFSAWSFYYQSLRGSRPLAFPANVFYVSGLQQIGVPVSFYNSGTTTAVVRKASLQLSTAAGQTESLRLRWISPFENRVVQKENKWATVEVTYTGFTVLPLKPGDTDSEVFWFEPDPGQLTLAAANHYSACAKFFSVDNRLVPAGERAVAPTDKQCSVSFEFDLDVGQVTQMKNNSAQHIEIDLK